VAAAVGDVVDPPSAEADADDGDAAPRTAEAVAAPEVATKLRRDGGKVQPFWEMWEANAS
jgi:hypothetical protein